VLITGNIGFLQHLPNLFKVLTIDAYYMQKSIDLYRPLQSASFILDAQWGLNPVFTAHITNLILHILACLTLYKLLRLLEFREKVAFLGALVYSVHYLFMTAVAWLPARGDLLLALFAFLSLSSFIKIFAQGGWRNYLLHAIFFTLAIFSKESAIVLPLLLALYLWAYAGTAVLKRCHLLLPIFYLAVQALYFWLKSLSVVLYKGDTGFVPLMKNIRTLPETVAKFYLPLNMSTLPAYQTGATAAGIVIIISLAALHLFYRGKFDRRIFFYAGWTLLFIVPGMLYYPAFYIFAYEHVDHRAYISCFGLLLITLNVVQTFELDSKRYFKGACLLLLAYLAAFNLYFSVNYRSPADFGLRAIKTNPRSAFGYAIYGKELYLAGRDDEALENLNSSVRIFRKYTPALNTRVLIYRKRGLNREALADLDTIIAMHPEEAGNYILRAQTKIDLQDYDGALKDFRSAIKLKPGNTEAATGIKELERTVVDNHLLANVSLAQQLNRQGIEAGERGDFRGAESLFRRALASDPGFYGVNLNLGNALYAQDRGKEACAAWRVAAARGSASAAGLIKENCGR
jgi:tetratricopeptide (TPR) repeat protein